MYRIDGTIGIKHKKRNLNIVAKCVKMNNMKAGCRWFIGGIPRTYYEQGPGIPNANLAVQTCRKSYRISKSHCQTLRSGKDRESVNWRTCFVKCFAILCKTSKTGAELEQNKRKSDLTVSGSFRCDQNFQNNQELSLARFVGSSVVCDR